MHSTTALSVGDAGANRLGFCSASALGFGINCTNGRHLILGEKFKAIFALYLIGPKEGALDTAKGHIGMGCTNTDVHSHHADISHTAEFFGIKLALRENANTVTKF